MLSVSTQEPTDLDFFAGVFEVENSNIEVYRFRTFYSRISKFTQTAGLNLVLHTAVQALHEPVSDDFGLPQAKTTWAVGGGFMHVACRGG